MPSPHSERHGTRIETRFAVGVALSRAGANEFNTERRNRVCLSVQAVRSVRGLSRSGIFHDSRHMSPVARCSRQYL